MYLRLNVQEPKSRCWDNNSTGDNLPLQLEREEIRDTEQGGGGAKNVSTLLYLLVGFVLRSPL